MRRTKTSEDLLKEWRLENNMTTDEKIYQAFRNTVWSHEGPDSLMQLFTAGYHAGQKQLLDEASEGFEDWYVSNQNFPFSDRKNNQERAWQAATLAAEKKHQEKVKDFEKRFDDEVCSELARAGKAQFNSLESKLALTEKRNEILKSAVEFYANKDTWSEVGSSVRSCMMDDDHEHIDPAPPTRQTKFIAGKRARLALKACEDLK